jgi:hypothetical protein
MAASAGKRLHKNRVFLAKIVEGLADTLHIAYIQPPPTQLPKQKRENVMRPYSPIKKHNRLSPSHELAQRVHMLKLRIKADVIREKPIKLRPVNVI